MRTDFDRTKLVDAILDAVLETALTPEYPSVTSYKDLSARAGAAGRDDFWNTDAHPKTSRWEGRPVVTVRGAPNRRGSNWKASIYQDKKGNATVLVPKGTKVIEVEDI